MSSSHKRDDLMPRPPDGIGTGLVIALIIHLGLVIAIAFGVNWRSREPEAFSAELWAAVPQVAAPRAVEPEPPPPKPEPAPPPPPPPPPPPAPKVQEPPPPPRDADIALEREKLERERKELEAERQRQQELARQRELEREKMLQAQQEKEKALQAERERQKREEVERQKREEEKKRLAEEKRQRDLEAQRKAEEARIAALRQENLKRIQGLAGATGDARSTGTAMRDAAPSSGYAGRIKAKVRPNIVFYDDVPGNPVAEVEVRLSPDGTIVGTRLLKSSGVPAWDDAVVRAVVKTEVLPRDIDGRVPAAMVISFRPSE